MVAFEEALISCKGLTGKSWISSSEFDILIGKASEMVGNWTKVVLTLAGQTWAHMRWGHLDRCLDRFWLSTLFQTSWMRRSGFLSLLRASTRVLTECWNGCWRGSWSVSSQAINSPALLLLAQPVIIFTSLSLAEAITLCFTCYNCQYCFYRAK